MFQFSGVRPLPAAKGSTGQISRDHSIELLENSPGEPWPILSLVGGKWTSYRAFSEQVTDRVLGRLNKPRGASTARLPIGGGYDFPESEEEKNNWVISRAEKYKVPEDRIRQLFDRYGTRAEKLLFSLSGAEDTPLTYLRGYSRGEITFLCKEEMISHLDDFLLRRTKLAWTAQVSIEIITELGDVIGEELERDKAARQVEIKQSLDILRERHAVKI